MDRQRLAASALETREVVEASLQQVTWLRRGFTGVRDDVVPKKRRDLMTRGVFFATLKEDMKAESGIFMLPLVLLLLFLFTGMVVGHERSIARQSLRSAIRDDILENCNYDYLNESIGFMNMENVKVGPSATDWMRLGFFDHLVWKTASADGNLTGTYLQYNRIVGGIRLLTQRMDESVDRCGSSIADFFETPCVLRKTDDRSAEGYDDLAFAPDGEETSDWSAGPGFEPHAIRPHRTEWFMMSELRSDQEERINQLIRDDFFDRQTQHIMLSMVLFNPDLQLICLVESNFFFSRTGRVWPLLRIKTIDPDPFHQPLLAVCDLFFFMLMFANCFRDFRIAYIYWKKVGLKHLRINLPHGPTWYFLDVVGFMCSFVLFVTFLDFYLAATNLVRDLEDNYSLMISDQDVMASFLHRIEEAAHTTLKPYRTTLMIYPFCLMMRLSLGFSGNPRLSMVTRVFKASFRDLFHYLIVFVAFFFTFTLFAMMMFGREVEGYSTMSRSLQSNVQMMFGDVDWEELNSAGFVRAIILYWAFHVSIVMIMFNILVAILLDTYETLVEEMGNTRPQTLHAQLEETWMRLLRIWNGDILSLNTIWMACFNTYGDQVLSADPFTRAELRETIPELSEDQTEELFRRAEFKLQAQKKEELEGDGLGPSYEVRRISKLWDQIDVFLDNRDVRVAPKTRASSKPATMASPVPFDSDPGAPVPIGVPKVVGLPADMKRFIDGSGSGSAVRLESLADALRLAEWLAALTPDARGGAELNPKIMPAIRLAKALVAEKTPDKKAKRREKGKAKPAIMAEIAIQAGDGEVLPVDDGHVAAEVPYMDKEPLRDKELPGHEEPRRDEARSGAEVWRRLVERGGNSRERVVAETSTGKAKAELPLSRNLSWKELPLREESLLPGDKSVASEAIPRTDEHPSVDGVVAQDASMERAVLSKEGTDTSLGEGAVAISARMSEDEEVMVAAPPDGANRQICCKPWA